MKKIENIIFYFPFKGVGGVSDLFIKLSEVLSDTYNTYLVDYHDGTMSTNNKKSSLFSVNSSEPFPKNSIVVFQSLLPWNIINQENFDDSTKVIFWNLHPYNLYPFMFSVHGNKFKNIVAKSFNFLSYFRKLKIRKLLKILIEKNSIYFMDYENKSKTEIFNTISINDQLILPIFIDKKPQKKINIPSTIKSIGYIGRLVDFKIYPLLQIIVRLDKLGRKFTFHIIGEGPMKDVLIKKSKSLINIDLIFHGSINLKNDNEIINNIDLFFAMGLSLLEIAARGIPVIPMDYSYKKLDRLIKLKRLNEIKNFNVAEELSDTHHFENKCTIENYINNIDVNYKQYSEEAIKWTEEYFSKETFIKNFICAINNSQVTIKDLRNNNFMKPDFLSVIIKGSINLFKKKSKYAV